MIWSSLAKPHEHSLVTARHDAACACNMKLTDWMHACAVLCLTALIALCVAWELWLAPLKPGGSWLVLKAVPLLAPLFGILNRRLYTFRWAGMLALAYFVEGTVRVYADRGASALLAGIEIVAALLFMAAAVAFVRLSSQGRPAPKSYPHGRMNEAAAPDAPKRGPGL